MIFSNQGKGNTSRSRIGGIGKGKGKQIPVSVADSDSSTPKVEQTSMPVRISTPTGGVRVEQVSNAGQKVSIVTR